MFKKLTRLGSIFLFLIIAISPAHARKNSDIGLNGTENNVYSGTIFSVRGDAFIYTFTEAGTNWQYRPEVTGVNNMGAGFNAITSDGKNTYVAVGNDMKIWYLKTDGGNTQWKRASAPSGKAAFKAVEFGNGRFVAVATEGTALYSDDGINWHPTIGSDLETYDPDLYEVIYANGMFIAVGYVDYPVHTTIAIFSSPDGIAWKLNARGGPGILYSAAYGNKTFVAVGSKSSIYISSDAKTWNNISVDASFFTFNAVTYNNGKFVAVGDGSNIWYSADGKTWAKASGVNQSGITFYDVTYGNGVFVAVGDVGLNVYDPLNAGIWYSPDGVNWSRAQGMLEDYCLNGGTQPIFESVYFDGYNFVATARDASNYLPEYYSNNGIVWQTSQNAKSLTGCHAPNLTPQPGN